MHIWRTCHESILINVCDSMSNVSPATNRLRIYFFLNQELADFSGIARVSSRKNTASTSSTSISVDIPEHQSQSSSKPSATAIRRNRGRFSISYEALVWIVFLVLTTLCVVDHFVLQGDAVLKRGGKLPKRIWGTNLGETITNVVWAVTARLIITSQNLMFYTMLWCFPNFIAETCPGWLTVEGIREVHVRIHRLAGIFPVSYTHLTLPTSDLV